MYSSWVQSLYAELLNLFKNNSNCFFRCFHFCLQCSFPVTLWKFTKAEWCKTINWHGFARWQLSKSFHRKFVDIPFLLLLSTPPQPSTSVFRCFHVTHEDFFTLNYCVANCPGYTAIHLNVLQVIICSIFQYHWNASVTVLHSYHHFSLVWILDSVLVNVNHLTGCNKNFPCFLYCLELYESIPISIIIY